MKYYMKYYTVKTFNSSVLSRESIKHLDSFWKGQNFISWLVYSDVMGGFEGDIVSLELLKSGSVVNGEVIMLYNTEGK